MRQIKSRMNILSAIDFIFDKIAFSTNFGGGAKTLHYVRNNCIWLCLTDKIKNEQYLKR